MAHKLRAIKKIVLEGDTSYTINPNEYNILNNLDYNVVINMGDEIDPSVVSMYIVRLTVAAGLTELPSIEFNGWENLKWYTGTAPTYIAGGTYEITIIDSVALWTEVQ